MPKELLIVPNERIDLDDFKYGTSTFTVDSLRDHVHRLMSGDYRGGFVLEGFRIENNNATTLGEIIVHNGIAIDRFGRLITAEDDPFTKNTDLQQQWTFPIPPAGTVEHYVMVEFELADVDLKQRVVWDPTFPNPDIIDSDNDLVPTPKGKEFSIDIPVRRAKLWKIVTSSGIGAGFTDSTDPNTVRIPIAIIPVTTGGTGVDIPVADLDKPRTTVMEKPGTIAQSSLVVANSRLLKDNADIQILDYRTGTPRTFLVAGIPGVAEIPYAFNDRDNNELSALTVDDGMTNVEIGDIVVNESDPTLYLKEGCAWDCRPMFFSFTDPTSATEEQLSLPDEQETRNMRFESGQSLIRDTNLGTAPWNDWNYYPAGAATYRRRVTERPLRSEDRLKQKQDFFRALAAITREVKYGDEINIEGLSVVATSYGSTPFSNAANRFAFTINTSTNLDNPPGGISGDLIGATLTFDAGTANPGASSIVSSISAPTFSTANVQEYIVGAFTPFLNIPNLADTFTLTKKISFSNEKGQSKTTQYVDNYRTGTLNEIYRARIDRLSNTWCSDLQERLQVNKIPIVTVGDGYKTFGDYNGDAGLVQALNDVYNLDLGGIIYVKRGNYNLAFSGPIGMRSNTVLMGEGKGATNIALDSLSYFLFETTSSPTAGQETADNIRIESLSITAFTDVAADTDGRGSIFTNISPIRNLVIEDVHFQGGSLYNNAAASPGLTKRYIGHIASVSAVGTYLGNYNITIKDSIFSVEGGGIFLDGCRNVKIHDCTFQSENSDFTFVGMSEGIVIDGNTPSGVNGARYGSNDPTLALGEVSISDCKFLGQQTNMSALPGDVPTRGWIFTTPDYLGSPIAVNNCQFVWRSIWTNSNRSNASNRSY